MKKSLPILVTLLAGAVGAYAQGQIEWDDYAPHVPGNGFQITVWSPNPAAPSVQTFGNGAADVPAGTQTYPGSVALGGGTGSGPQGYGNGANYSIELLAGAGANATTLSAVPGAVATFDPTYAGSWDSGGGVFVAVPGVAYGAVGTFQLQAWYNGGGTLTYAQAQAAGDPYGSSITANITLNGPPGVPSTLNPITSFSLQQVPEPSTIALGIMGASAFLMRLRRKQ